MDILHKLCMFFALYTVSVFAADTMDLSKAESYAVSHAPEIHLQLAKQAAYQESAVSAKALPDPKMSIGAMNVPTDTFSFTQENMTQVQIGVMQSFPKGNTLEYKSLQQQLNSTNSLEKAKLMQLTVLKMVRTQWLQLFYWQQALSIYQKQEKLLSQLTEAAHDDLASNQLSQKDVVQSQFQLSQLQQKILIAKQKIDTFKAQLYRWIPVDQYTLVVSLPKWKPPPDLKNLEEAVKQHPEIKSDQLQSQISEKGIAIAEQQEKPGYSVGVMYGLRQGDDSVGDERSDFVGAQVTLDLPLFKKNLQDRDVAASKDNYLAMQDKEQSDYKQLLSQVKISYVNWQSLQAQYQLYQDKLLDQAALNAKSTQAAYENKQADYKAVTSAQIQDLTTQLNAIKIQVDGYVEQANLMYLQGITS